ncbi:hypothetical protein Pan153_32120 [Gimesia panareensis]|uniref:Carboxymuconolactone decarboxylase family protein n=1 Tax=Gimesia panareensis TaxID=2527978 RepID=A0A518FQD3_9PLAN|nr:hypothetical protein [Gimesia panareensis]QDV18553.1 hypothetical protein Pan153_32120 [Gimesia panareensis]
MSERNYLQEIADFETHYQYEADFMRELLAESPDGYAKFAEILPLARHRERLNTEAYFIAKLAAMQVEDCGTCLQLCVRFAREADVPREIVEAVLQGGSGLSADQRDLYDFAVQVASSSDLEPGLQQRIQDRFDRGQLLELGLCIATAKVFPTIKRAAGYLTSCRLMEIEV